jgi:hypothetical protein
MLSWCPLLPSVPASFADVPFDRRARCPVSHSQATASEYASANGAHGRITARDMPYARAARGGNGGNVASFFGTWRNVRVAFYILMEIMR